MIDEWYTLPGVPSDLLSSSGAGIRRLRVDIDQTATGVFSAFWEERQ